MKEFDVLRKAFPEQEPPTPATTEAARRQLREQIHKPVPSFARTGRLGTAITAATALVAVTGLGGALVMGHGEGAPAVPSAPTTTAPRLTTAAEVLIATAVRQEKNEKVSGKYFRVRSLQVKGKRRVITESWMPMQPGAESWFGWVDLDAKNVRPVVNKMSFTDVPPGYYLTGDHPLSAAQIAALPTDPAGLRRVLSQPGLSGSDQDLAVFAAAGRLLFELPSPPKLRGAALRVLAAIPGTKIRTGAQDPLGRAGTEITITPDRSRPSSNRSMLFGGGTTYIIDPATGRLLSSTLGSVKVHASVVVLESGWTDDRPTPPSPVVR
jgi:hypothetical protein